MKRARPLWPGSAANLDSVLGQLTDFRPRPTSKSPARQANASEHGSGTTGTGSVVTDAHVPPNRISSKFAVMAFKGAFALLPANGRIALIDVSSNALVDA